MLLEKADLENKEQKPKINWEEIFFKFRIPLFIFLFGAILIGFGVFYFKNSGHLSGTNVEVLNEPTGPQSDEIIVEVSGAVEKPGVYKFQKDSRIDDALVSAGGLSVNADRDFIEKTLNRAAKLIDGQKIYIPSIDEQSTVLSAKNSAPYQSTSGSFSDQGTGLTNINTSSQSQLEDLVGIGPVYAQKIIEHRPYSNIDELLSKDVLPKSTYEKIKDEITVY